MLGVAGLNRRILFKKGFWLLCRELSPSGHPCSCPGCAPTGPLAISRYNLHHIPAPATTTAAKPWPPQAGRSCPSPCQGSHSSAPTPVQRASLLIGRKKYPRQRRGTRAQGVSGPQKDLTQWQGQGGLNHPEETLRVRST